jgi:hypothetical protein
MPRRFQRIALFGALPLPAVAALLIVGAGHASAASSPYAGVLTMTFPGGVTAATGVDAFQSDPVEVYVPGAYTVAFTSCSGGSALGGTYLVGPGNVFPTPPTDATGTTYGASNAPFTLVASAPGGTLACQYTVTAPTALPAFTLSLTNELFLFFSDGSSTTRTNRLPCSPPTVGGSGEAGKNIDTNNGCDSSNGTSNYPVAGYISVSFPAAVSQATGVDAFQANPSQAYPAGSYTVSFTGCSGGSISDRTYDVGNSSNQFPTPPTDASNNTYEASSSPLSLTAATPGGTVSCAYSVSTTGSIPPDSSSMKNDIIVFFTDGNEAHFASQSVAPYASSTPATPEAPQVALIALAGIAVASGAFVVRARRRA